MTLLERKKMLKRLYEAAVENHTEKRTAKQWHLGTWRDSAKLLVGLVAVVGGGAVIAFGVEEHRPYLLLGGGVLMYKAIVGPIEMHKAQIAQAKSIKTFMKRKLNDSENGSIE